MHSQATQTISRRVAALLGYAFAVALIAAPALTLATDPSSLGGLAGHPYVALAWK